MILDYLRLCGFDPMEAAVVTLATDGYSAAKSSMLMICLLPFNTEEGQEDPETVFVQGGDVTKTADITRIPVDLYKLEGVSMVSAGRWFGRRIDSLGVKCLIGHSIIRFTKPFLETMSEESVGGEGFFENLTYLDTQALYAAWLNGVFRDLPVKGVPMQKLMADLTARAYPKDKSYSLDAMSRYFHTPMQFRDCFTSPTNKARQTSAALRALLQAGPTPELTP